MLLALVAAATLVLPQAPAPAGLASPRDFEKLQDDLENLDGLLETLEPNDAQADAFRARAQTLQEDVVYLKVRMRRHQEGGGKGTGVPLDEVDRVRREAAFLREDIERAFGGAGRRGAFILPAGAEFTVRLGQELSSKTARVEDRFEATIDVPVQAENGQTLEAGTVLRGIVRSVEGAERPAKAGRLDLDFYALYLGPERYDLRARVVQIGPHPKGSSTAKKAGIGSVLGGVLGAILSGGTGAVIGIVAGGGGVILGSKGEEIVLPEGTRLRVRLDRALEVRAGERPAS
jgi:hypothetical protein